MKKEKKDKPRALSAAFKASLPVMAGYLVLGAGFGMVLADAGLGIWVSLPMSLFIYAGSMQFVAVELFKSSASLAAIALTALTVNARHVFYGLSVIDKYKGAGIRKPYLVFSLTDETYALVAGSGNTDVSFCFYVSLLNHIYWVLGSAAGSLAASVLPFDTTGIDFSLTALFVSVLADKMREKQNVPACLTGLAVTGVSLLVFGADMMLIPAMLGISAVLLIARAAEGRRAK